jgi:hemoglobin
MVPNDRDIVSRADIEHLVNHFYNRVRADEILGPIFDDVAHTDWDAHLPKMYDF